MGRLLRVVEGTEYFAFAIERPMGDGEDRKIILPMSFKRKFQLHTLCILSVFLGTIYFIMRKIYNLITPSACGIRISRFFFRERGRNDIHFIYVLGQKRFFITFYTCDVIF